MEPTLKVAKEFPNIKFEHITGYKRSKNVATGNIRFYEGRYIQGVVAGLMTKTNKIGYIGAYPIAEVIMGINAFAQGLRSVNKMQLFQLFGQTLGMIQLKKLTQRKFILLKELTF